jgi:class 3 adenylate cyclase
MGKAASVRFATDDAFRGDEVLFRYCSELAMGLALLRASYLDAEVRQLTVWDRGPAHGAAGTAIDVAAWRRRGGRVTLVSPTIDPPPPEVIDPPKQFSLPQRPDARQPCSTALGDGLEQRLSLRALPAETRIVRAMLFGDVKRFSLLNDEQSLIFARRVLGELATVLDRHRSYVCHRRAWGDAVFVVLTDAANAAACALDLQDAMASLDLASEGLPEHLALRLGAHLGPVLRYHDPVLGGPEFTGSHVIRTARIEPVTPPGAVYVTEPFAAALVLADRRDLTCDYVGHMPTAKDYGRLRMYRLGRTGAP